MADSLTAIPQATLAFNAANPNATIAQQVASVPVKTTPVPTAVTSTTPVPTASTNPTTPTQPPVKTPSVPKPITAVSSDQGAQYAAENTKTLQTLKNTGLTLGADGIARYSDSSFATAPSNAVQNPETGTWSADGVQYAIGPSTSQDPELQKINDQINNMKTQFDTTSRAMIDNIKAQWESLINEQKDVNMRQSASLDQSLLMGGSTRYAQQSSTGQSSALMSYGLRQIGDLQTKETAAILQAQQAMDSGDMKLMDMSLSVAQKARADKQAAAQALSDKLTKANDELVKKKQASEQDSAISSLLSQGVTDPNEILKQLTDIGYVANAKDVADSVTKLNPEVKEKSDILLKLAQSGNNVPQSVYEAVKAAKNGSDAVIAAGNYLYSEADKLDIQYKKVQIAKVYSDIESNKQINQDPSSVMAYASEYAATGKIPTGLPKGSFGTVAQIAKELPKTSGQILSGATGVTPTTDTALQQGIGALYSATQLAKQLKELDALRSDGIIAGTLGKVFGSEEQQRYVDLKTQITDLLSRARSGAALNATEEARYSGMLPGRFSEPLGLGVDPSLRIDNFINALTDDLSNKASAQGWVVNGVSKVDINGSKYTVGDVIKNGNGQTGRVNSDGTITLLQ